MHLMKLTLLALILLSVAAHGQIRERASVLDKAVDQLSREELAEKLGVVPMEGPINPEMYVVGPSDMLQVSIWGPLSVSHLLPVTPEGTLIIPTVGEVRVADLKLSEAKKKVTEAVRKRYTVGEITVTLLRPRSFVVTLRGVVLKQGQYLATPVDRVEKVLLQGASVQPVRPTVTLPANVAMGSNPTKVDYVQPPKIAQIEEVYDRASTRNILLIRRSGDSLRVDIPQFYATGEDRFNPFLLDGDVIVVPQRNLSQNFIFIQGVLNAPGRYEYVEGDSLLMVLRIAQGLRTATVVKDVTISRLNERGEQSEQVTIDLHRILEGKQADIPIHRGDRIVVNAVPDRRGSYNVVITGEVRAPGVYPIALTGTKLSHAVQAADGFTENALLTGSAVFRKQDGPDAVVDLDFEYLRTLRSSQVTAADSSYYHLLTRIGMHPVVVDFQRLFVQGDTTQDIPLSADDIIYVASNRHTVLVQGQVANPGYLPYVQGARYEYYIQKAGGYSEFAVEGDTRVIKKNSLEWVEPGKTVIEPGDQIWVPKRVRREFRYYFEIFRDAAGITAALATAVLLAIQLSK